MFAREQVGLARETLAAALGGGPEHAHEEQLALARAEDRIASPLRPLDVFGGCTDGT